MKKWVTLPGISIAQKLEDSKQQSLLVYKLNELKRR
jgi:hypothetical protein